MVPSPDSQEARREVLDWLLALNQERYAEEVRVELHEKKGKSRKRKKKKVNERQARLF